MARGLSRSLCGSIQFCLPALSHHTAFDMTSTEEQGIEDRHDDDGNGNEAKTYVMNSVLPPSQFYQKEESISSLTAPPDSTSSTSNHENTSLPSHACYDCVGGKDGNEIKAYSCPPHQQTINVLSPRRDILHHTSMAFTGLFRPKRQGVEHEQNTKTKRRDKFLNVLHNVLSLIERDSGDDVNNHGIAWLPHGRSFIVQDKKRFLRIVASSYFKVRMLFSTSRILSLIDANSHLLSLISSVCSSLHTKASFANLKAGVSSASLRAPILTHTTINSS